MQLGVKTWTSALGQAFFGFVLLFILFFIFCLFVLCLKTTSLYRGAWLADIVLQCGKEAWH